MSKKYRMTKYLKKDSILIRNEWSDSNSVIQTVGANYQNKQNFLTEIIGINYDKEKYPHQNLKEGDMVFLSKYFKSIKSFSLGSSPFKYYTLPILIVMGAFRTSARTLESLEIFDDKVLVEEITGLSTGGIILPDQKDANIGKVIKTGKGGFLKNWTRRSEPRVKEGDIVLFWNNVGTPIYLHGKKYTCIEDARILGKFTDGMMHIDFLELLDNRLILEEYVPETLLGSNILIARATDEDDMEMSTIPINQFKVKKVSKKGVEVSTGVFADMGDIKEGDIVIVEPSALNYVDFKGNRYFTLDDLEFVEAVIPSD